MCLIPKTKGKVRSAEQEAANVERIRLSAEGAVEGFVVSAPATHARGCVASVVTMPFTNFGSDRFVVPVVVFVRIHNPIDSKQS